MRCASLLETVTEDPQHVPPFGMYATRHGNYEPFRAVINAADDDITAAQINPGLKAPECGKDVTL